LICIKGCRGGTFIVGTVWTSAFTGVTAVARNKAPVPFGEPGPSSTTNQKNRGGRMTAFAQWLAGTSASMVVQKTLWLIPLMQTIHIVCVALVFSSVVMIEFRVLGYRAPRKIASSEIFCESEL
jgi:hypothetical protein